MPISSQDLTGIFLSPQMRCYFQRKLPDVPPAELDVRIEETLKFLNIAVYCNGSIPVTQEIDDIWHLWILETKEYNRLCASLQGREYIHHSSHVYAQCGDDAAGPPENDLEEDVAMLATYVRNYGSFEASRVRYWRLAAHLVEKCGWRVEGLNDWLAAGAVVRQ
jgi:hypothetical protein